MARPKAEDYDIRRETIVDAAAYLIAKYGFFGASMSEIAKACGMSKPALYHYFVAKEDVLFAVMEDHVAELVDISKTVAKSHLPPEEKLARLCRNFMTCYVGAKDRHKVLLNELGNLKPADNDVIVAQQREILRHVFEILTELEPSLKGRQDLKTPAAMLVMGMLNWTHTWFDADGDVSSEGFAEMVTGLVLGGLQNLIIPSP
ncbi:MAG: TetR/AcrR family transcriptional regulator [Sphingomonadales bacterium]|jgi:AcrR family transcriptional regulator